MPNANITKHAIADTMKHLMTQKPLSKISIGDIVEECGINRNSFYYHFKDKYDLVNWIFYTEITEILNDIDVMSVSPWKFIEDLCTFLERDKVFYQNALSITGQNSFAEYFVDLLKSLLKERASGIFEKDEDQDFFATFFADAFVVTIYRWISDGATVSPKEFSLLMKKAATGAAAVLQQEEEAER